MLEVRNSVHDKIESGITSTYARMISYLYRHISKQKIQRVATKVLIGMREVLIYK